MPVPPAHPEPARLLRARRPRDPAPGRRDLRRLGLVTRAAGTVTRTCVRLFPAVPRVPLNARVSPMSLLQIALITSIQRERGIRGR